MAPFFFVSLSFKLCRYLKLSCKILPHRFFIKCDFLISLTEDNNVFLYLFEPRAGLGPMYGVDDPRLAYSSEFSLSSYFKLLFLIILGNHLLLPFLVPLNRHLHLLILSVFSRTQNQYWNEITFYSVYLVMFFTLFLKHPEY